MTKTIYRAEYCTCGSMMTIEAPREVVEVVMKIWDDVHCGDGHAPTTAKNAYRVREEKKGKAQ